MNLPKIRSGWNLLIRSTKLLVLGFITVNQLRKVIKEEVSRMLSENTSIDQKVIEDHYRVYANVTSSGAILYKASFTAPEDLPRFIWVKPDGTWVGRDSKMLQDPIVASGSF